MRTTSARSSSARPTMSLFTSTAGIGSTKKLRPGARRAVDDARHLPAVLGLQQQDVAVVAHGDELVLQDAVGVLALAGTTPSPTAAATSGARAPRRTSASFGDASSATSPVGRTARRMAAATGVRVGHVHRQARQLAARR